MPVQSTDIGYIEPCFSNYNFIFTLTHNDSTPYPTLFYAGKKIFEHIPSCYTLYNSSRVAVWNVGNNCIDSCPTLKAFALNCIRQCFHLNFFLLPTHIFLATSNPSVFILSSFPSIRIPPAPQNGSNTISPSFTFARFIIAREILAFNIVGWNWFVRWDVLSFQSITT